MQKKSQHGRKQFLQSTAYEDEFSEVFGVVRSWEICIACSNAVRKCGKIGRKYQQVGNAIPYNIINIFKMIFSKQFINTIKPTLWSLIYGGLEKCQA